MSPGRSKFFNATAPKKVMPHDEFINRIRKSLYFGCDTNESDMEISRPLAEYAAELFSEPHKEHSLNRLTRVAAGRIHATPCSLIMALIYLDRLNIIDPGYARRITPQELFIVSLMISTKFYAGYDQQIYLEDWAKEGSMAEDRLKELELEFLSAIDWNIYISNEQFFDKLSNIERTLARREGLRRGWLTYNELAQWLPSFALMKFLLNNFTVMAVSYAASVITIAGAFFLASQIPGTILYRKPTTTSSTTTNITTTTTVITTNSMETPLDGTNSTTDATPVQLSEQHNISVTINSNNISCNALNVEAELLKLEQQYCEEARLEDMKRQQGAAQFPHLRELPSTTMLANKVKHNDADVDSPDNWLSIKSEYSDDDLAQRLNMAYSLNDKLSDDSILLRHMKIDRDDVIKDCFIAQNGSLFWNFLNVVVQHTFVRVPEIWLKYI